jgi:hypothetical protein
MERFDLQRELRQAAKQGDAARIADLKSKFQTAERHRSNALEAARDHAAEAHPQREVIIP